MKNWVIDKGPHVLFTGGNGRKTTGITLRNLNHIRHSGYAEFWSVNDISFAQNKEDWMEKLGLSESEYLKILQEVLILRE